MIAVPISLILAATLGFLFLKSVLQQSRMGWLDGLLLAAALQGLLISLLHYYQITSLRPVVPITAAALPPLAWLAVFATPSSKKDGIWLHMLGPLFAFFCLHFAPLTVDAVLALLFLGYGGAILIRLSTTPDLPQARIAAGNTPKFVWICLGTALIFSGVSDILIAVALSNGWSSLPPAVLSIFTLLALLAILALALAQEDIEVIEPPTPPKPQPVSPQATELVTQLDRLLNDTQMYLDPDLTLTRLARKLGIPSKQISAAVNQICGENISRHVNAFRIRHACALLEEGASVTEVIFASGFNTKSNFNREFQRIMGETPSKWVQKSARQKTL